MCMQDSRMGPWASLILEMMTFRNEMLESLLRRYKNLRGVPIPEPGALRFGPLSDGIDEMLAELPLTDFEREFSRKLRDGSLFAEADDWPGSDELMAEIVELDVDSEALRDAIGRELSRFRNRKS